MTLREKSALPLTTTPLGRTAMQLTSAVCPLNSCESAYHISTIERDLCMVYIYNVSI